MEKHNPPQDETPFEVLSINNTDWGGYKNQDELLEKYVSLTEDLIEKIQNYEIINGVTYPADVVIFIDKSARPVSWFVKELWPTISEPNISEDGEKFTPDLPELKFVNIDRLAWRRKEGVSISDHPDNMRDVSQADIDGLRSIYLKRLAKDNERISDVPSFIDGKRVLIVDEIKDSGDTMYVASKLLSKAFPDAKFKTCAWMNRFRLARDGKKQVLETPNWYTEYEESGRGVSDPAFRNKPEVGKGVSSSVGPKSLLASKKKSVNNSSLQFLSTRPLVQREQITEQEKARIKEIEAQLSDPTQDEIKLKRLNIEKTHLEYDTVDRKGLKLRREIARVAEMLSDMQILPYLRNFNGNSERFFELRRAKVEERKR